MKVGDQKIEDPIKRFSRYLKPIKNGCIEWIGARNGGGYGLFSVRYKLYKAHRYSYEFNIGKIGAGLVLDHICRNRSCVNAEHLRAVTQKVNASENTSRTLQKKCKRGHDITDKKNLLARKDGARMCKMCHYGRVLKYKNRLRASHPITSNLL